MYKFVLSHHHQTMRYNGNDHLQVLAPFCSNQILMNEHSMNEFCLYTKVLPSNSMIGLKTEKIFNSFFQMDRLKLRKKNFLLLCFKTWLEKFSIFGVLGGLCILIYWNDRFWGWHEKEEPGQCGDRNTLHRVCTTPVIREKVDQVLLWAEETQILLSYA